jgi:hypothetical protein
MWNSRFKYIKVNLRIFTEKAATNLSKLKQSKNKKAQSQ